MVGRGQRAWLGAAALLASVPALAYAMEDNAPGTTGLLEAAVGGKRTLVLADWPQIQDSHSMFFSALKVRDVLLRCGVACYPIGRSAVCAWCLMPETSRNPWRIALPSCIKALANAPWAAMLTRLSCCHADGAPMSFLSCLQANTMHFHQ